MTRAAPLDVLALTRYGRLGASSRIRTLQYIPFLAGHDIRVRAAALLPDRYLIDLYAGRAPRLRDIAAGCLRRVRDALQACRYPVIWVEKELLPWLPLPFEHLLRRRGSRLVLDYDDAVFARYEEHRNPLARLLLKNKIATLMREADVVLAGNSWLREYARSAGARDSRLLPSAIDLTRYPAPDWRVERDVCQVIGWIGTPSTVHYLRTLSTALTAAARRAPLRLVCIGADPGPMPGLAVEYVPWTEHTEAQQIRRFDVGIMPLPDGRWERGKCAYKLIQYMASGVPVIASAVGANCEVVTHEQDGLLVAALADWPDAIERMRSDAGLRRRLAEAARLKVERGYSLQARAPELAAALRGD